MGTGYVIGNWNALLPGGSTRRLGNAAAITPDSQFVVFDAVDNVTGHDQAVAAEVAFSGGTPSGFTRLWVIDSLDGTVSNDGFVSAATDISSDGNGILRVVGYAYDQSGAGGKAFLWKKDLVSEAVQMINLDPVGTSFSQANGVNSPGEVIGNVGAPGSQAFFWNTLGIRQQLPTLGGARSYGNSLNDAGLVVGTSQRSGKNVSNHAFIWRVGLGIVDLNTRKAASDTSGLELTTARKINNVGHILAYGVKKTGGANVLLTPIP
jgi:probable HAF family extracellular repeat protein